MPFAKLSPHHTLYYLDENPEGQPAILLLHGLGANSNSWLMQIPQLVQSGYRVVAPDAPGFGKSHNPGGKASPTFVVHLFSELIDQLGLQQVVAVGISMGGVHALQLALDHPEKVKQLVLVNTFSNLNFSNPVILPYFALRLLLVHTLGLQAQAKAVAKRIFPKPEQALLREQLIRQVQQAEPRSYRASMRALARINLTGRLKEINCPTLIIAGERDTTVPLPNQTQLAERIPNARQVIIPHAGHAVSVELPELFNQTLLDFLGDCAQPNPNNANIIPPTDSISPQAEQQRMEA